jgi:mannose-6-phosphate isomerase-like protein (cupin superfamily)
MQIWDASTLAAQQTEAYAEFVRISPMSMGIYKLPAGSQDDQTPHNEDEAYYVLSGKAKIEVDGEVQPVKAGSIIFVPALVDHRFKKIEEDLVLLVFFTPAFKSK